LAVSEFNRLTCVDCHIETPSPSDGRRQTFTFIKLVLALSTGHA